MCEEEAETVRLQLIYLVEITYIKNQTDFCIVLCGAGTLSNAGNLGIIGAEVMRHNGGQDVVCFTDSKDYCAESPLNLLAMFIVWILPATPEQWQLLIALLQILVANN